MILSFELRLFFIVSFVFQLFRSILERCQFSPTKDLEKNNQTGLIRLADYRHSGDTNAVQRIEGIEKVVISYFRSRKEDNLKKAIPSINLTASSKSRILPNDAVHPSNPLPSFSPASWTTGMARTSSDPQHGRDARPVPRTIGASTLSAEIHNDSFFHPSLRDTYNRRYLDDEFLGQLIYYDDAYGNSYPISPEEISF